MCGKVFPKNYEMKNDRSVVKKKREINTEINTARQNVLLVYPSCDW